MLKWDEFFSANTRTKNRGKGFIEGISEQLRKEQPGLRGFSASSHGRCVLSMKSGKLLLPVEDLEKLL